MNNLPVVFLLGPTACGKTAVSIAVAKAIDAQIVSVDSTLVYRGMDIGTAKPDMAERDGIEHHLIDICDAGDPYSVARFCKDAMQAIDTIQAAGKIPILTGGTMLYFNALEHGLAPLPDADQAVRKEIEQKANELGWAAMHAELAKVDPAAAQRIHPNDPQRLQRALEVYQLTGEPLTELQKQTRPLLARPPVKIALMPESREWLHQRIEQRFSHMLEQGFIKEVRRLKRNPALHAALPSMRSVGYRQAWQFLEDQSDEQTMIEQATAATRQLAKRQITWIRSMQSLHAIAPDSQAVHAQVDTILGVLE